MQPANLFDFWNCNFGLDPFSLFGRAHKHGLLETASADYPAAFAAIVRRPAFSCLSLDFRLILGCAHSKALSSSPFPSLFIVVWSDPGSHSAVKNSGAFWRHTSQGDLSNK
jgi:hypothetical protein